MTPEIRKYTDEELDAMSIEQLKELYGAISSEIDDILMTHGQTEKTAKEAENMLDNLVKEYYK